MVNEIKIEKREKEREKKPKRNDIFLSVVYYEEKKSVDIDVIFCLVENTNTVHTLKDSLWLYRTSRLETCIRAHKWMSTSRSDCVQSDRARVPLLVLAKPKRRKKKNMKKKKTVKWTVPKPKQKWNSLKNCFDYRVHSNSQFRHFQKGRFFISYKSLNPIYMRLKWIIGWWTQWFWSFYFFMWIVLDYVS